MGRCSMIPSSCFALLRASRLMALSAISPRLDIHTGVLSFGGVVTTHSQDVSTLFGGTIYIDETGVCPWYTTYIKGALTR
ncbi:hypothetical protein EDD18DRAFT_1154222 [Armillaria luteobubalina]|uniref:Secreted protein n=1 Tax=Armillaria luteobubalina TaxID=153913 RepID=A0AA39QB42_9AGAR|nr:hypothetical protein EDD18DRAFT_1154222 [Armillaria luteobubalina]